MKSLKKGFLMLTSVAMAVGALLIGGSVKETEEVKASTGTGTWNLVTDASTLGAGDKIVIASNTKNAVAGDITSQYLKKIDDATFAADGSTLTLPTGALELTLGGSAGTWTLAKTSGELLGATAVKKLAWGRGTTTWDIKIAENGNATIQNGTSSYGRFLYNSGSPRFTTYTSKTSNSMMLPQIYRFTIVNKEYTVSFVDSDKTTTLSDSQIANEGNNHMITEPTVTKEGYTFGGWYLEEEGQIPVRWNFNDQVEKDMILVAHWDDAKLTTAKTALNSITSYMSYGYKYDVTSTKYGCISANDTTDLNGKNVVIVGGVDGKYYAMNNTDLTGVEVNLTSSKLLDFNSCLDKLDSIKWMVSASEKTEGAYNLKNSSDPEAKFISNGTSETTLTLGATKTDYNIFKNVVSDTSNYYLFNSTNATTRCIFNRGSTFKNYAKSNFASTGYADEMYIFVVGNDVTENTIDVTSYTHVDFRLKCGINDSALKNVTLPEGATYGIEVSTGTRTVKYEISDTNKLINIEANSTDTTPTKYVIIGLDDVINKIERATTEFTTRAYLKVGDVYYYSDETNPENKKTYSVASLTVAAMDANVQEVVGLYRILNEKGCFTVA